LLKFIKGTWQFVSGKLLSDSSCVHGLEDDRESVLWVLLWISLRFTAHDQAPIDLATVLELFDEKFNTEDGVRGGRLKDHALVSANGVPYKVKFKDRPALDSLFKELASTFAVRYENKPSQDVLDELEQFQQNEKTAHPLPRFIEQAPAYRYKQRTGKLVDPTWLVDTINGFLQDRSRWPLDDKAIPQLVGSADGTRKRTLDQARMELQVPRLRKVPKTA
jgi:hypothetical protein